MKQALPQIYIAKDTVTLTWTTLISVLQRDGKYEPVKLIDGFDSLSNAHAWVKKHKVCATCFGSGQINLTAANETIPAVCIECKGKRVRPVRYGGQAVTRVEG